MLCVTKISIYFVQVVSLIFSTTWGRLFPEQRNTDNCNFLVSFTSHVVFRFLVSLVSLQLELIANKRFI